MLTGRCGCGSVTYRMNRKPMFVHCCHCRECQRQTGSAFVINAIVEADEVSSDGPTSEFSLPTPSGKGQIITRCAHCGTAVFSSYLIRLGKLRYVRVGTLDDPDSCPPDVNIFTASKLASVTLPPGIPAYEEFYSIADVWPLAALERWNTLYGD